MTDEKIVTRDEAWAALSKTKVKTYDTTFKLIFENPDNVVRLYNELTNNRIGARQIEVITLTEGKSLITALCDDLGFLVKNNSMIDDYIILIEAQSTWNPNMGLRMFRYLGMLYEKYLNMRKLNPDILPPMYIPKPKFYILYTGSGHRPDKIWMSEMYNPKEEVVPEDLNFAIFVLSESNSKTLSGEYIGFCKTFAKYKKLCDTFGECYLKTIAECRTKGYLISFIDEHEKEVKKAMDFNYTDRRDFDIYMDHFETQVRAEGEAKGLAEGKAKGLAEGKAKGRAEGLAEGEAKGKITTTLDFYKKKLITREAAIEQLGVTPSEFEDLLKNPDLSVQ
ncbi:hypothetical protein [Succinimonas sp.]|uniref:hypothetical protein n=1 Tax=Succinimonas sp. TaxID=1936151 RepID=UPI00386A9CC4